MGFFRPFTLALLLWSTAASGEVPSGAERPLTIRTQAQFTPERELKVQLEVAGAREAAPDWDAAFPGAVTNERRSTPDYEWRELQLGPVLELQGSPAVLPVPRLGDTGSADYVDEEIVIELPPGYTVTALPSYREVQNRFFHFRRQLRQDGSRLTETTQLQRKPGWDNPALPGHREAATELASELRQEIVVAYRPEPPPGVGWMLSREQRAVIRDRHTLEVTTAIRCQTGGETEILWQGAGLNAETPPRLIALTVTDANGREKAAAPAWHPVPVMSPDSPVPSRRRLIRDDFALTVPAARTGDLVEFTIRQEFAVDQPAFAWQPGTGSIAVARDSFELRFPREMAIAFARPAPDITATSKVDSDTIALRWEAANPKPEAPALQVALGSYADYASALLAEVARCTEEQPEAARLAREIAGNAASEADQVRLLRDTVANRIALLPGVERLRFADLVCADDTLRAGSATPCNRTLLLFSLLSALDIHAEAVAVADRYAVALSDAQWNTFTPMWCDLLLRIVPSDGAPEYYLGDGDEFTPPGSTAWDSCVALDLTARTLDTIQVPEELKSRNEWELRLEVESTGDARLHWRKRYHGIDYARRKKWLEEADDDTRMEDFRNRVARIAPDAGVVQPIVHAFDGYPGEESFVLELTDWTRQAGPAQYAELPGLGEFLAAPDQLLASARPGNWSGSLEYTVTLPPAGDYAFSAYPAEACWTVPANGGEISFTSAAASPGEWKSTMHATITPAKWQSTDLPGLNVGRQLLGQWRRPFVFFRNSLQ